ncbi:tetratricopeptide repeat protein [Devosia sp. LjRoot16]|uniref:tetratricopeptide repeat-containing sulfotransferase family protein n=1 Tax=Devosia sp. LjRoot16 TaxID=3342271 RepID=UPI003ECD5473
MQPQGRTVESLLQRGIELHQAGRGTEAAGLYQQILRLDGGHPAANHLFGLTLMQQGEPTAAIRHIAVALKTEPSNPQYLANMGVALSSAGRNDEAVEVLQRAVAIQPASAETYSNLGMANRSLGRFNEAADAYRHAAEIRPTEPAFHFRLASMLRQGGDHFAAEASYRKAIELRPGYAEAYDRLAFMLIDQGRAAEALELLDRGLAVLPEEATLHMQRARSLYAGGAINEAIAGFDRALTLRPTYGEAHLQRATSVRHRARDGAVAAMEGVFRSEHVDIVDRIFAGFALGKALADIGDHSGSIAAFIEANRMQRQRVTFSLNREADLLKSELERFRDADEMLLSGASSAANPVFIVGLPRSGKSTLELILASHPAFAGAGELPTMGRLVRELLRETGGLPLSAIPANRFAALGRAYMEEAQRLIPDGKRVIDTMPSNYHYLGFIRLALPNARIIHCVRPPAEHRVAIFEKFLTGAGFEYSNELGELRGYHSAYSQLMSDWHTRFPGFIRDLDVGALMSDRRAPMASLLQFLGADWDEACLAPAQSEPQQGDWSSAERAANHSAHMAAWREVHPELWA